MDQQAVWDAIARDWKEFRDKTPPEVITFLGGKTGTLLDLGCGTGRNFIKQDGLNIYGCDFSKQMIALAKERAASKGIQAQLTVAESDKLPYENVSFDFVLCYAVLHCVQTKTKREKTLQEIHRVLKAGGQAFISVWGRGSPRIKNKEKESETPWKKIYKRYTYIFDKDELESILEETGFKIIRSWEDQNINLIVSKP